MELTQATSFVTDWEFNLYLKDPKTGEKSVTLTFFVIGFLVALGKLLLSGITVGSVSLSPFTGVDFAAVTGALGGIYALRRNGKAS